MSSIVYSSMHHSHNYITEKNPDTLFTILLDVLEQRAQPYNKERIREAYLFAREAHQGQKRASGEEYICHPLAVAITLARYNVDEDSIIAGLLHDVVEDCQGYSCQHIATHFGDEISCIVEGVTKITKMHFSSKEEAAAENIRKMILAMTTDLRVILVKLADRLHNLHTLSSLSIAKQQRIAHESLEIYAPIANRLGLHRIKLQLEDLGLSYIKPEAYRQIQAWVEQYETKEKNLFENTIVSLQEILQENGIDAHVYGRVKQVYSIYKKIQNFDVALEELHDIIAFRVLVNKVSDCYAVLGLVHSKWKFIPQRFKDYISLPKSNGYKSLHTTIFSSTGHRMEVQIRTHEMHELAEYGVASHWLYKENGRIDTKDAHHYYWLHKLIEEKILEEDPSTFLQSLRLELFQDEVYVFTPKGAVIELPEGSSPIDFAYAIHSELGDKCTGARINTVLKPLHTVLQHGDIVEIITDNKREPSRSWLEFVKTGRARSKIKAFLRKKERQEDIVLGKSIIEKLLKKHNISFAQLLKQDITLLKTHLDITGIRNFDDFFIGIAHNTIPTRSLHIFFPTLFPEDKNSIPEEIQEVHSEKREVEGISLSGMSDILIEYASCCNPVYGDAIVGYISRGRGVVVHNIHCKHLDNYEPERLFSLNWEGHPTVPYSAKLLLRLTGSAVLQDITAFFVSYSIPIEEIIFKSKPSHAEAHITIQIPNISSLYKAIQEIEQIDGVKEVYRV